MRLENIQKGDFCNSEGKKRKEKIEESESKNKKYYLDSDSFSNGFNKKYEQGYLLTKGKITKITSLSKCR